VRQSAPIVLAVRDDLRYLVLDLAGDEAMLWELTWGMDLLGPHGQRTPIHLAFAVEEVRPVLAELVAQGLVELYDNDDPTGPTLSRDQAQAVIADDGYWIVQSESGKEAAYALALTDVGEEQLQKLISAR
jgi:hypothetical protein